MTSERARSYARIVKRLDDLEPAKLHADEAATIRDAADSLLFAEDLGADKHARAALDRAVELSRRLVASGRWLPETADAVVRDLEDCGPMAPVG